MHSRRSLLLRRLKRQRTNRITKLELQQNLTSIQIANPKRIPTALIRCAVSASLMLISACAVIEPSSPDSSQIAEQHSKIIPRVDLKSANWQKFSPTQPDSIPLRIAVLATEKNIGATRIAIRVPPGVTVPPHWHATQGTYVVLSGSFIFDSIDADGMPEKIQRVPGDAATIPANYILKFTQTGNSEAVLYLTLYGPWAPQFQSNPWGKPVLRGVR